MDERVGRSPHDRHCRSNFVQDVRICTGSSDGCFDENTVFAGHRLIENKKSVRFNEPDRGEIVIINDPDLPERLIEMGRRPSGGNDPYRQWRSLDRRHCGRALCQREDVPLHAFNALHDSGRPCICHGRQPGTQHGQPFDGRHSVGACRGTTAFRLLAVVGIREFGLISCHNTDIRGLLFDVKMGDLG